MAVDSLRCRICEASYPAIASGICVRCFGPLEPVYDWEAIGRVVSREQIEAGPRSLWRYDDLLPTDAPADAALGPGLDTARPAPRLASALGIGELYLKLDLSNPTHSFKDRVVAVAAQKALEFGLGDAVVRRRRATSRTPSPRAPRRSACRAVDLLPGRPRAGEARRDHGLRRADLRRARQLRRLLAPRQRAGGRGRLGVSSTSICARTTRRARRRSRSRSPSSSAGRRRTQSSRRIGSGCDVHEDLAGVRAVRAARADRRASARSSSAGQAVGCSPVALGVGRGPAGIAGAPADGRVLDRDRQRRPTATSSIATAKTSGGAIYAVPEDEIGDRTCRCSRRRPASSARRAAGVTLGALRDAPRRARSGSTTVSSCSSPAPG